MKKFIFGVMCLLIIGCNAEAKDNIGSTEFVYAFKTYKFKRNVEGSSYTGRIYRMEYPDGLECAMYDPGGLSCNWEKFNRDNAPSK